jgi:hypothetical protein
VPAPIRRLSAAGTIVLPGQAPRILAAPSQEHGSAHRLSLGHHAAFHRDSAAGAVRRKAAGQHGAAQHHAQSGGKGAHAGNSHAAHGHDAHGHDAKGYAGRPARHAASNEVSDTLVELEESASDFGRPYAARAAERGSAWGSHAGKHHAHAEGSAHLKFETFYHPFICDFLKSVTRLGIDGLLTQANQRLSAESGFFERQHKPTGLVARPLPAETVDFGDGAYAIYNQELFFHIPDLIAEQLRQNQRYDDAIRWLKFIFDPTDDNKEEPSPQRYWKYEPLKSSPRDNIQKLIEQMESGDEKHSQLIADWAKHPFEPYVIARHRPDAYKKNIFIKYVRTIVDHADALFRSDLKEAVNEAEQLYVIAARLLGPKPENIAAHSKPKPECYASLRDKLDTAATNLVWLENEFPFSGKVTGHPRADSGGMQHMGRILYFCAPKNVKLLELWDIVADRLYKIRNCLNFEGYSDSSPCSILRSIQACWFVRPRSAPTSAASWATFTHRCRLIASATCCRGVRGMQRVPGVRQRPAVRTGEE